eukprot:7201981-Lingulodinium_polyedra.AAC.1
MAPVARAGLRGAASRAPAAPRVQVQLSAVLGELQGGRDVAGHCGRCAVPAETLGGLERQRRQQQVVAPSAAPRPVAF